MAKSDKLALMRVGETVVLMVEVFPAAIMLALTEEQAVKLSDSLREMVNHGADYGDFGDLGDLGDEGGD